MNQTTTSSCTRKYAQKAQLNMRKVLNKKAQLNAQLNARNSNKKRTAASIVIYKRVMVKLVRLLSARPAAVSLVAIGLSLPYPL